MEVFEYNAIYMKARKVLGYCPQGFIKKQRGFEIKAFLASFRVLQESRWGWNCVSSDEAAAVQQVGDKLITQEPMVQIPAQLSGTERIQKRNISYMEISEYNAIYIKAFLASFRVLSLGYYKKNQRAFEMKAFLTSFRVLFLS